MRIESHVLRTAPDEVVRILHQLDSESELELKPEEAPPTLETFVSHWQKTPSYRDVRGVLAWDGDEPVGYALVELDRSGNNDHIVEAFFYVVPERRRQGLGRHLVRSVLDLTDEADGGSRTLLLAFTATSVPVGAEFVRALGGDPGLEERESELRLDTLDRGLVERWMEEGPGRAPDYELLTIEGDVPDELVEQFAALYAVTSDAPRGSLEIGDGRRTPEQIRDAEQSRRESGQERILCLVRHRGSGRLAGWTELGRHPSDPEKVHQYWTAVHPDHRGHALGKWLKAAALVRALERWPDAKKVTTGNAYTNAAMLGINDALGFRETIGWTVWQAPVAEVRARLG